jgi:peptidoglycan-associated lipoprotein
MPYLGRRKVKQLTVKWSMLVFALSAIMFLGACHKKAAPPPPPPPPPPASTTASLTANPESVDKGQSTTLTWQTSNATDVSIGGIGAVQANGSQQVTPADSTTYTLTAKGPGGTQEATARVTVNMPAAPPPPTTQSSATEEELFSQNVKDIYFGYDKSDIGSDQQSSIQDDVNFLKQHPNIHFTVEGHCDERGSTEYNLALGDSRAGAVKGALVSAGVGGDSVKIVSYGKEKPFCSESNEQCWQQNRRGHFVYQR